MRSYPARRVPGQRGITGLETAIILIAFVVLAPVFAFTVLSTGIFSSEKGKETVYAGLSEARSSLEPRGSMIAYKGKTTSDTVFKVSFVVSNAVDGEPINLTPPYTKNDSGDDPDVSSGAKYVTIAQYQDKNQFLSDVPWTVKFIGASNGDNILDHNEVAEISVWLLDRDTTKATSQNDSVAYMNGTSDGGGNGGFTSTDTPVVRGIEFTLEIRPPKGQVLSLNRTLPDSVTTVMDLR
jgi:flagellin FlaB